MNSMDIPNTQNMVINDSCLLSPTIQPFEPQAEDILTDEDLLDLFRIVKKVLRKNPDPEKLAKLLFCMAYALGDHIKFSKPCHEDRIIFRDNHSTVHSVRLPSSSSCCSNAKHTTVSLYPQDYQAGSSTYSDQLRPKADSVHKWVESSSITSATSRSPISPLTRLPSVSHLTNGDPNPSNAHSTTANTTTLSETSNINTTDPYLVRPYSNIRSLYTSSSSGTDLTIALPSASVSAVTSETTSATTTTTVAAMSSPIINGNQPPIPSPSPLYNPSFIGDTNDKPGSNNPTTISIGKNTAGTATDQHRYSTSSIQQAGSSNAEVVMEPQQRGFYYQDGRIAREPVLLQRYAEQGILTQASLMRKRKRQSVDVNSPYEISSLPVSIKKPKIPHRHGEFEQRRDDIISRMRNITMADLEQKAQRLPNQFTLAIDESVTMAEEVLTNTVANGTLSQEQLAELLEPALRILTNHSNMKPHLDNGMNQNGIYYNSDYFRLYLAFEQFQRTFSILFPNEVMKVPDKNHQESNNAAGTESVERDKDRERNANMKAYRVWIEPLLTETNWAAFRRNIVVGERMMQLTKSVGQGVLLMTKELSGSKLHLTFTNSEWDEFINGLTSGRWDQTIEWDNSQENQRQLQRENSQLVCELQCKFATHFWFHPDGFMVSSKERRIMIHASTVNNNNILIHRNSVDLPML